MRVKDNVVPAALIAVIIGLLAADRREHISGMLIWALLHPADSPMGKMMTKYVHLCEQGMSAPQVLRRMSTVDRRALQQAYAARR